MEYHVVVKNENTQVFHGTVVKNLEYLELRDKNKL